MNCRAESWPRMSFNNCSSMATFQCRFNGLACNRQFATRSLLHLGLLWQGSHSPPPGVTYAERKSRQMTPRGDGMGAPAAALIRGQRLTGRRAWHRGEGGALIVLKSGTQALMAKVCFLRDKR